MSKAAISTPDQVSRIHQQPRQHQKTLLSNRSHSTTVILAIVDNQIIISLHSGTFVYPISARNCDFPLFFEFFLESLGTGQIRVSDTEAASQVFKVGTAEHD